MSLIYQKLPEDTNIRCCYARYTGYITGAAYACDEKAEYVLMEGEQMTVLSYCKEHMHTEWIDKFIAAGREVEEVIC